MSGRIAGVGSREGSRIELVLRDVDQLFNTLDPFPFREKDLSPDVEKFIVDWAQELPHDRPLEILITLPSGRIDEGHRQDLRTAVTGWFSARARSETQALRLLVRDARLAWVIGLTGLSGCLLTAWILSEAGGGPFARVLQESLVIIGWVVIWRPAEMVLYDWAPMLRRRSLFRRLASARVIVEEGPHAQ